MGEFEEMYRYSATTPLNQDKQEHWIDARLTKEVLKDLVQFHQIHDFDCGTGHFLELMANTAVATNGKSYEYDVLSAIASEKAASFFPHNNLSGLVLTQRTTNNLRGFS